MSTTKKILPFTYTLLLGLSPLASTAPAAERLDRHNLLVYRTEQGQTAEVKTVGDWLKRRASILDAFQQIAGRLPGDEKRCPLNPVIEEEVDCGSYVRRLISYSS